MHEVVPGAQVAGSIELDGVDIYSGALSATQVRTRIGMVFQKPNPFPAMSIGENVLAGLKLSRTSVSDKAALVEESPRRGGHVGRGQGSPERGRNVVVGRPAATALHRRVRSPFVRRCC